jgi:hypothetical protein
MLQNKENKKSVTRKMICLLSSPYKYFFYVFYSFLRGLSDGYYNKNTHQSRVSGVIFMSSAVISQNVLIFFPKLPLTLCLGILIPLNFVCYLGFKEELFHKYSLSPKMQLFGVVIIFAYIIVVQFLFFKTFA